MINWDTVLESHLTAAQRQKLRAAQIGIAGAGGLGSNVAMMLARSGIGSLSIADPDIVSLSNLNRQHYMPCHLGRYKVEALQEQLMALHSNLVLKTQVIALDATTAPLFFEHCDVVVEAVDDAKTKRLLVETLLGQGYRVVSASGMAGWGGDDMTTKQWGERLTVVGDHQTGIGPGKPPLAPRVMIAAAMQADAVLCAVLGRM